MDHIHFFPSRTGDKEHILLTEYDKNSNEWEHFDLSLDAIQSDSFLIFEATVFIGDDGNILDDVNIAIDDITFTPQCK